MVGKPEQLETLLGLLRPYSAHVAGAERIRIGCASRYLGLLAAALSRFDEAATFLRDAVEVNDRIEARPWSAYAKADLARVLLLRDRPGDREAAGNLNREALAAFQQLGMTVAAGKIIAEVS